MPLKLPLGKIRQLNFITRAISIRNKTNRKNLKQNKKRKKLTKSKQKQKGKTFTQLSRI